MAQQGHMRIDKITIFEPIDEIGYLEILFTDEKSGKKYVSKIYNIFVNPKEVE